MFTEALEWLQAVFERINRNPSSSLLSNDSVLELIIEVTKEHDALLDEIPGVKNDDIYNKFTFTHKIMSGQNLITRRAKDRAEFLESTSKLNHTNPRAAYEMLCSGRDFVVNSLLC